MKIPHIIAACLVLLFFNLSGAQAQDLCPPISSAQPSSMERGQTSTVTFAGSGLADTTGVSVDDERIQVQSVSVSDTEIVVELTIGNRALSGSRDVTFHIDQADDLNCAAAFEITAGDVELFRLEPDWATRGGSESVQFNGLNLDQVAAVSMATGIDVSDFAPDATDPTRATALISVGDEAPGGPGDVSIQGPNTVSLIEDAFSVAAGDLAVTGLNPSAIRRGESAMLTAVGQNLDAVDQVTLGTGVQVGELTLIDPTSLQVAVTALPDALPVGAARDVDFSGASDVVTLDESFTVNAGDLSVTRIRPDRVTQDSQVEITIDGTNLDGVDQFDAGVGVTAASFDHLSPTRVLIGVSVAADAAIGLRDVDIAGTFGSETLVGDFGVLERVDPPADVNYPDVIDVGHVEIGARKRFSLTFHNDVDATEAVVLDIASGDIAEFRFWDDTGQTLAEINPSSYSFNLGPLQEEIVIAEYRPSLPVGSTATIDVQVRGERIGGIEVRGTGNPSVLGFSPESPVTVPPVREDEIGFRQVSTLSSSPERTLIESFEVHVEQNNGPFAGGESLTMISLSEPLLPEVDQLFGATLITIETDYPIGAYEGEIWFTTDRPTAPVVPLTFFTTVSPEQPQEETALEPVDTAPDAGNDMASDPVSDAGTDFLVEPDTGDAGVDSDGQDTAEGDEGAEGDVPASGCCGQATDKSGSQGGGWLVVSLFGLTLWPILRRRRR